MTNNNFEDKTHVNSTFSQLPAVQKKAAAPSLAPRLDWEHIYPALQWVKDYTQPILLRLAEKKNVRFTMTRTNGQTSLNFSFQDDSIHS